MPPEIDPLQSYDWNSPTAEAPVETAQTDTTQQSYPYSPDPNYTPVFNSASYIYNMIGSSPSSVDSSVYQNIKNLATGKVEDAPDDIGQEISKWVKDFFSKENAERNKLLGGFLSSAFTGKYLKKKAQADMMSAEASKENAETNSLLAQQKINAGNAMGKTNFGDAMKNPNGLIYQDLAAVRRNRSGYTGA